MARFARETALLAALLAAFLPAGCGTILAVGEPRGDPLIYLGAQRDLEFLQSPLGSLLCFCVLADTVVSAVLDTLILPYGLIREAALDPGLEEGILVEERLLGRLPGSSGWGLNFSADANHAAVSILGEDRKSVWIDGNTGPPFRDVLKIVFSGDGARWATGARDEAGWRIVVDGKPGERFDRVHLPLFSPDGKRVAFAAERDGRAFVVVDGAPGEPFDEIGDLAWSPNGATLAFAARRDRSWFMMRGAERGPDFGGVAAPTFSPDGARFAYAALPESSGELRHPPAVLIDDPVWRLIVDGKEEALPAAPRSIAFSGNGRDVAWRTREDGKDFLVVSGRKQGPFESAGNPVCRPGGKDLAFSITRSHRQAVVTPEGEIGMFRCSVSAPTWSPDGRRVAFKAWSQGYGYCSFVVAGRRKSPEYDEIKSLGWNADGSSVFFGAQRGREVLRITMKVD